VSIIVEKPAIAATR